MAEIKQKQKLAMRQYLRTINPKEEVNKYTDARRFNLDAIKSRFTIEEFGEVADVSIHGANQASPRVKEKPQKVHINQTSI
jgi:hypothetical protein